jgi:hypothetical protein
MILVFIGSLLMSFVLLHSIVFGNTCTHRSGAAGGLKGGFFSWLGFIAPASLTNIVYEQSLWKL